MLDTQPATINSPLPDTATDNFGQLIHSNKIFVQNLSDRTRTFDDSFVVYLNIEHSSLQDLYIKLVSPKGKSVVLLDHQASNSNGFKGYFTAQFDDELQALIGQPSWGTWRLEISDRVSGNSGELKEWSVGHFTQFQCSTEHPDTNNDKGSGGSGSPIALLSLLLLSMVRAIRSRIYGNQ